MNDADREIVERLLHHGTELPLAAADLIESQATEIKRLKASLNNMEAAYVARVNIQ